MAINTSCKIGILMGGSSAEREISLKSGRAVSEALLSLGLDIVPIDIQDELNVREQLRKAQIQVAFICLHGSFGEDGRMQEVLEQLSIPYTGSGISANRLGIDKWASRKIFQENGLSVPKSQILSSDKRRAVSLNGSAVVVKPSKQGSSIGVSFVNNRKDLDKAVDFAFQYGDSVIIEEYVRGRELTVGILEERALPVVEIIPKHNFFDFEAKYKKGLTEYFVPAKLKDYIKDSVQSAALKAHKSLGCKAFSRVDIILKENTPFILEINTIPGMTETSLLPKAAKAAGIEFKELCQKLLEQVQNSRIK